jgi:hypothetical protein
MTIKGLFLNVDYLDQCMLSWSNKSQLYLSDEINRLAEAAANAGVDAVMWRISFGGRIGYHGNAEDLPGEAPGSRGSLGKAMKMIDPLAGACSAFSANGIDVYGWLPLFDDFLPYFPSRLCREHPDKLWLDRTGTIGCQGIFSMAYPEIREFKINIIREALKYPVKGLMLCMRSHSSAMTPYRDKDFFGYEEPVREEFFRRYGTDIRACKEVTISKNSNAFFDRYDFEGGDFDREAWHRLKGDFFTLFLREARKEANSYGKQLMLNVNQAVEGPRNFSRFHHDYSTMDKENLIDGLSITEWQLDAAGKPQFSAPEGWNKPVALWCHVKAGETWRDMEAYREKLNGLGDGISGLLLHEAATFEFGTEIRGGARLCGK